MNWVLGLVGALFGVVLSESRNLLGLVVGFFSVFLLVSFIRLRSEMAALRLEMASFASDAKARAVAPTAAPAASMERVPPNQAAPVSAPDIPVTVQPDRQPSPSPLPEVAARAEFPTEATPSIPLSQPAPIASPAIDRVAAAPAEPGWQARWLGRIKEWFTEGNVPVKIGVLVLLFGVAAALRYAAAQGLFTVPLEVRLAGIAAAAVAALGLGWRERQRRPAFGLSLQGGALGVLLLTVFATYKLYHLLPPGLAFALIVVLVAGSALLAVLQQNMMLAVLGFLGGYLAPVLISTGSGNHIALFTYYAVLNAAVFAISWKQNWRLLNLIGFGFTFGVGAAWGDKFYRPELFASVEPFLILFFVFYIIIGLLYVVRQSEHRRPWVDGTLVFGTPLVAFPLQAAMLKDDRLGMAFSALVVALVYASLVYWLRRRRGERLLAEAYAALALGFATLAVPLAFSASTTASVWALEGAGVAWLGLRQQRNFPWLTGLGLQLLAAGAYVLSLIDNHHGQQPGDLLLLNAEWLGAAMLSFSGFALSLIHDRHHPRFGLPPMLFAWAVFWWLVGGLLQLELAKAGVGQWQFIMLYLIGTAVIASWLRVRLTWPRLDWLLALCSLFVLLMVPFADSEFGSPLATPTLPTWALYLLAFAWSLWHTAGERSKAMALTHLAALWTVALAITIELGHLVDEQGLGQGWQFLALVAPIALLTLGLWRRPNVFAWPRASAFAAYRAGWFWIAVPLGIVAILAGLFDEGSAAPALYVPVLNPLELALIALCALLFGLSGARPGWRSLRRVWPLLGFAFASMATLRAVHHWHGEPWSAAVLESAFSQASLTVVWSLIGVIAWVLGSRWRNRQVWMGGALLMGVVLLKLLVVDRTYVGNMAGIVSFMAVGLLLVGVGYFAPSPPKLADAPGESA